MIGAAPAISFDALSKVYPAGRATEAFVALHGVALQVQQHSFVCLLGPSGCGKSTLLNLAAGLIQPTTGAVSVRRAPDGGTNVAYLTQHNTLLPWRTVRRNVAIPLEIAGVGRAERAAKVAEALRLVGLERFADHYPSQLSGGMQRRALLARIWVGDSEILLMDEPFGALDAQLRVSLQLQLVDMWEKSLRTVLFVTHDLEEAILLGDRIVVMGTNPGRVIHEEITDLPRPRDFGALRQTSEFQDTWHRLWELLRPDFTRVAS